MIGRKKRVLAAGMTLSILLGSGCASMLERDYAAVSPHSAAPAADGNSSVLRVERYQDLVNALSYLIGQGRETGAIRFYMEESQVQTDLDAACLEVVKEDPLGAYAVDFITYRVTPTIACVEADIQITYRRTPEQIAAVVAATGPTAIRGELKNDLAVFAEESVLRISYFEGDEAHIRELVEEAYYAGPATALDLPDTSITIYPESGRQCIVEILMSYHLSRAELQQRRDALKERVEGMTADLPRGAGDEALLTVARAVLSAGGYRPDGGSTAYHALLGDGGDSEGLALALALLCQARGTSCQVVQGTLRGEERFWNVIQTETGYQFLDLSRENGEQFVFLSNQEMTGLGYQWNTDTTPLCSLRASRVTDPIDFS